MNRIVITCRDCGNNFTGNGRGLRCPLCRIAYNRIQARARYRPIGRNHKVQPLEYDPYQLYQQIKPGMRKIDVARLIGRDDGGAEVILAALENRGLLLSEDEHGRIYPYSVGGCND